MSKKISFSAWSKYLSCPYMYFLHYIKRLRPSGKSSPLMFGVAIDEALNVMLLKSSLKLAIDTFRDYFKWEDMNEVNWDSRDMDHTLVSRDGFDSDSHWAWACMRVKGRMLLEEYYNKIYPLIEEVESVQKNLHDRPGIIDCIVKLRGHGRVLLDNKTAARPYQPDAIGASTQLALYARDQGIKRVGFAVLVKQIQKNTVRTCTTCSFDGSLVRHKTCPQIVNGVRCHGQWAESHAPKAVVQLMVQDITPALGELVHASMCEVERGIEAGIFPCNINAHRSYFGKESPYLNYLLTGDMTGLEIKPLTNESNNDTLNKPAQYTNEHVDAFLKENEELMNKLSKEKK